MTNRSQAKHFPLKLLGYITFDFKKYDRHSLNHKQNITVMFIVLKVVVMTVSSWEISVLQLLLCMTNVPTAIVQVSSLETPDKYPHAMKIMT